MQTISDDLAATQGERRARLLVQLERPPRPPPNLGQPAVVHRHDSVDRLAPENHHLEPNAGELAEVLQVGEARVVRPVLRLVA